MNDAPPAAMVEGRRHDLPSKLARKLAILWPARRVPLRGGAVLSFTFDDIPDTAAQAGAATLERHGARGTFYVAGGLCGRRHRSWTFADGPAIADLAARGHEIACHTFAHPDMQRLTRREVEADLDRNAAFLATLGLAPRNFAYPYGSTASAQKGAVQRRFRAARGTQEGFNGPRADLGLLRAFRLYDHLRDGPAVDRLVAEAVARGAWLIFYAHDVEASPSEHGCTPGLLDGALLSAARHAVPVLTVDAALDRLLA